MRTWRIKADLVTDPRPQASLNYPDGFIDEGAGEIVFCWEDVQRLFLVRVPLTIST
jgi:hypothetical protein